MRLTARRRWTILGLTLAVTLVAVRWAASRDEMEEATPMPSRRAASASEAPRTPDSAPRLELERLHRPAHKSARADPFARRSWGPAPAEDLRGSASPRPAPARAQAPPPVPFTYMGKALERGEVTVFLSRGENVYLARRGDTLDGTYRVERLDGRVLVLNYLPLGQRQELALGEIE